MVSHSFKVEPLFQHLGMIQEIEHPLGGSIKLAGNLITSPSIGRDHQAPPTLGQHTGSVLWDVLGYSDEIIEDITGN